ncbi:MAG: Flp pilus assembly protein CpaB [Deltaproteobacteria bacterium]|nr:Flp pilus assembly protein CpaB [Deltaproteobacteria bacterium]
MFFWKKKRETSSSSGRWKSKAKELLPLFAGLALTLAAILLARHRLVAAEREIHKKAAPVEIVVPSVPIPAGGVFSEQNLAKKPVPSSGISSRNVPAAEFELLLGARAKGNLAPGEPILWTDVDEPLEADTFSQTIPERRRALTLEADQSASFAGLIRPGDRVDLYCEGGSAKPIRTWFRDVPVIAVDRNFDKPASAEEAPEVSTVTVSVTPEEGRILAGAAREGRIHWFLRNPDEMSKPAIASSIKKGIPEKVEIWKGGVRELRSASLNGELE